MYDMKAVPVRELQREIRAILDRVEKGDVADGALPATTVPPGSPNGDGDAAKPTPRHWSWAKLMQRAFAHPINCNSRGGGDRARPGHASLPSAVRAGA